MQKKNLAVLATMKFPKPKPKPGQGGGNDDDSGD